MRWWALVAVMASVVGVACGGGGGSTEATVPQVEQAVQDFLGSLGPALRGDGPVPATGPLGAAIERSVQAWRSRGTVVEAGLRQTGPARFDVGDDRERLVAYPVAIDMREVDSAGNVVRQLQVEDYDLIVRLRREGDRWLLEDAYALPWIEMDAEPLTCRRLGMSSDRHRAEALSEMRRTDVPQQPVPAEEMEAISDAWRCYWVVTADALLRLDSSLLPEVASGRALEDEARHVQVRRDARVAMEEEVVLRRPVLVQYFGNAATIDVWVDGRGRGIDPTTGMPFADWDYDAAHFSMQLRKRDGLWKVDEVVVVRGPKQAPSRTDGGGGMP